MPTPDPSPPAPSSWREQARSRVLNVLVLNGLSILATALIMRRWAPIEVDADLGRLKLALLMGLFVCFVVARIVLRAPAIQMTTDPETQGRAYVRSRVATAVIGWLALPMGLGYGLTVDPSLRGVAPFWIVAMLLGATALPRRSDLDGFDEPATRADS